MKRCLVVFALAIFFFSNTLCGQTGWDWATMAGGGQDDHALAVASDANGNIYSTGGYRSQTLTFGSITLTNSSNTGTVEDMFVVKYDPYGNVLWARTAGGSLADNGWSIATDAAGNVYVAGVFESGWIIFGSDTLTSLFSMPAAFLVKYDPNGNVVWAKSPVANSSHAYAVSCGVNGRVHLGGYFRSATLTLDADTITNSATGQDEIFVAELDTAGTLLWLRAAGGNADDETYAITSDAAGNIFAGGYFMSSSITFGSSTLANAGYQDAFILKYDANGNPLWGFGMGASNDECVLGLAADGSGNVYSTGYFRSSSITAGTSTLMNTNAGLDKPFIISHAGNGVVNWAQTTVDSGSGSANGVGIATNGVGNIFVAIDGHQDVLTFGAPPVFGTAGCSVFELAPTGVPLGCTHGGEEPWGICATPDKNACIAGRFRNSSTTFGSYTLNNSAFNNTSELFVAKLGTSSGIDNPVVDPDIHIYPNPGDGFYTVQLPAGYNRLEVYDATGRLVLTSAIASTTVGLDLRNFGAGIYLVRAVGDDGVVTQRVVHN